jgi:hypothetical protein
MEKVRRALQGEAFTAIREVCVEENFALVMTAWREGGSPTPDYDLWTLYNISLATGKRETLASGYGVKLLDWIGSGQKELAISYFHCWECEASTLFTTLHFVEGRGWRARWHEGKQDASYPKPGVVALVTDVGDPYDDTVVDQVFAVVAQPNDSFAVGSWFHSRDTKSGKIEDYVERYWIDAKGIDRFERLSGAAARPWQRIICDPKNSITQLTEGLESKSCKTALHVPTETKRTPKP